MLNESGNRAVHLAVSRYGADPARVEKVLHSVLKAQGRGESVDLLDVFLREHILDHAQVRELRVGLGKTRVNPLSGKNGVDAEGLPGQITVVPASAPTADEETPGDTELRALGEYRIMRRLGEGGTGAVFLAYHEKEDRHVAIKILAEPLSRNQAALDRFYREAKSGALLNHPNIVRNLAIGRDQELGLHYLVLEFVDGPSAQELLDDFGHLPVGDAVHIVLDSARGLEHAHSRNVVHRDIKPGNILLSRSGLAKIADMGLAKRTDETSHLTHARQGFGTPYYMPYEQAMNAKYADARSDIYALGATFYHLLVGDVPFPGKNSLEIVERKAVGDYVPASSLNPDVPRVLDHILAKMLAREPRDRYQTASEVIVDLERSNLSASVPSFIDPDQAMRDPVVRQRLTSPAKTTSLDLRHNKPANQPFWYLRYRDRKGKLYKAKLTYEHVLKRLRSRKISLKTEAARLPGGDFKALSFYAEFQDIDLDLATTKTTTEKKPADAPSENELPAPDETLVRRGQWWIVALCAGVILVVATTLILLLRN